ncbi:hypothetical protein CRE_13769 [Caenorhabditis remanei]|uniref:SPK domain-containing protein n=1 Tax=Caenorhabditis remanei TaxID=31234 RepID=E3NJM8_CAERE|nr:hypothetical protein CRE_13769 [Caenorhabditis remanei]
MTAGQPENIETDDETTNIVIEYRVKIHELENMDEETKIRMIFALSAPDVQTDHARRITEYKTKEGGFELRGTHPEGAEMREGAEREMTTAQGGNRIEGQENEGRKRKK